MKSALSVAVIASLLASTSPVAAQVLSAADRPLARSLAREAARLAVVPAAAQAVVDSTRQDAATGPKRVALRWSELAPLIAGQEVEIVLASGTAVKGEAVAIRDDGLLMDETHGATLLDGLIPRAEVTLIKVRRTRGGGGRTVGTIVGIVLGVFVGGNLAVRSSNGGAGFLAVVGVPTAFGVLGYHAGKQADTRVTTIQVVP